MSPWFFIVMICKHFLLLLLSVCVCVSLFIFLNAVFCFLSLGNKWERAVVFVTDSIQPVLTPTKPAVILPRHCCFHSPPTSLVFFTCCSFSFCLFDFCRIFSSTPPPPPPTPPLNHRVCDLLSVHANLFTPPAVLSPPSILCLYVNL